MPSPLPFTLGELPMARIVKLQPGQTFAFKPLPPAAVCPVCRCRTDGMVNRKCGVGEINGVVYDEVRCRACGVTSKVRSAAND